MALAVRYTQTPIWQGRTGGKEYSLHRAELTSTVGWSVTGYVLVKGNKIDEFYYGNDTTPHQGLWDIFIDHVEAGDFTMPAPDRTAVENFIIRFGSLCERGGEPLL